MLEPAWEQDLDAPAVDDVDQKILYEFWDALEQENLESCERCKERWFDRRLSNGICFQCRNKDKNRDQDEPFFFSEDNHLDFGPGPAQYGLPELSMAEEMLIARVHVAINVLQVRGQQYKYRGHVVQFFRNIGKLYHSLPLLPANLEVILLKPSGSELDVRRDAQFRRRFLVRRSHIRQWLEHLRQHHPGYRGFEWNHAALDSLPENSDILDQIHVQMAQDDPSIQPERGPGVDNEGDDDGDDSEDFSAVPNLAQEQTEMELLEADLDLVQERAVVQFLTQSQPDQDHRLSMPSIRRTPINEFNKLTPLFSLAFPSLFPCGKAEFLRQRVREIGLQDWVGHAMRWDDSRFARHPTFRFVALNMLMRSQASQASRYFVSKARPQRGNISREELVAALEDPDAPRAKSLLNAISRAAVNLKGTRPFWFKKRHECEAFAKCLGVPGAFVTLSPADLHWLSLYQHMPQFAEWRTLPEKERMRLSRRLLKDNPHIAAWNFYRRTKLFRDIILKKKFALSDFWHRFEFQNRGSPHSHGLYWFGISPYPDMETLQSRVTFARLWGNRISAVNPEPLRSRNQDEGNPLSVRPQDQRISFRWLSQIINRCQRHLCSEAYCLRVDRQKARDAAEKQQPPPPKECRFNFPFAVREVAEMATRPGKTFWHFLAQRNDAFLNCFSRVVTFSWLANTDISPCTSVDAVVAYVGKYATKVETKSASFADMTRQILPHVTSERPLLSFVSKMLNKLIGERDYSAQEVCHLLLNLPLQEGSRAVLFVDCRPSDKQTYAMNIGVDGVSECENLYGKYLARDISKPELAELTFFELISNWNFRGESDSWSPRPRAKERVLNYFPKYKDNPHAYEFDQFCRVKLMLSHPHQKEEELLWVDGYQHSTFESAYKACRLRHYDERAHPDNHYGGQVAEAEQEFVEEPREEPEMDREPWQDMALMNPFHGLELENLDVLGNRAIDINYDWFPHVGRFTHPNFANGTYWREIFGSEYAREAEYVPLDARDTLNTQQRLAYDTVIGHSQQGNSDQLLLQIDGGGGTGKSYLIKILSAHLRQAREGIDPVAITAPTGAASSNIRGTTIHSFLRLPVNKALEPLSSSALRNAQARLRHLKYLIIDEKSMLSLRVLGWISMRLSQIFPERGGQLFGGVNVVLIGDFFQLPPVGQKSLYHPSAVGLKDEELLGYIAYRAFTRSIFLSVVQRLIGDEQADFRQALEELRIAQVSMKSFELLSSRVASSLPPQEVEKFDSVLHIYSTKEKVRAHNHKRSTRLKAPIVLARAIHRGSEEKKRQMEDVDSDKAGNLHAKLPLCQGMRVMLTRNISSEMGLVNGAQGEVFDIGWEPNTDPKQVPPSVVMVAFDDFRGPAFRGPDGEELLNSQGKKVVPILHVRTEFQLGSLNCSREQFPLTVAYAITVHKAQGITLKRVVVGITTGEFAPGLNYVACSRATTLQGLLLDTTFPRKAVNKRGGGG